jgi:pyruvate/2-oxoglutarate dehydrogenase complex dihydrolipoamide dehydrogenase (E3) component
VGIAGGPGAVDPPGARLDGGIELTVNGTRLGGDVVLVATGRQPNVEGLGVGEAGVRVGPRGIVVDRYLRTSQPRIYACGDVLGGPLFTHYAAWQGYYAVRNALLPGRSVAVRDRVPWTLFTDPEVAQVGLAEPEARARHGGNARVAMLPLERIDRAQTDGDRQGFVKVVHRANGELLGAHIVAARAGEMIHEYALAMARGLRLTDLAAPIHVYPTYSTGVQQLAAARLVDDLLAGWRGPLLRALVRFGR